MAEEFNPEEWLEELEQEESEHQLHRTRELLKEAKQERDQLRKKLLRARERLSLALAIREPKSPKPIKAKVKKKREAVPVALASDWHIEEIVRPETVNGKNTYNLDISKKRAENFFDGVSWMVKFCRKEISISEMIFWIGGDMISGYIHEELKKNNALSPIKAILRVQQYLIGGIDFFLEDLGLTKLHIPCNYGNHERDTQKPEFATGAESSYAWLMYHTLAAHYAKDKRVEFYIPEGELLYFDVYDKKIRFNHGDPVKYQGGIGGLNVPLHKAVYSWNQTEKADLTVIGHWHQFRDYGHSVVNGSLIGYNAYCIRKKIPFEEPMQGFFLMDKKHGKSIVTPIWVS